MEAWAELWLQRGKDWVWPADIPGLSPRLQRGESRRTSASLASVVRKHGHFFCSLDPSGKEGTAGLDLQTETLMGNRGSENKLRA